MKQEMIDEPRVGYNKTESKYEPVKATCPKCDTYGTSVSSSDDIFQWKCPHCSYEC